MPDCRLGICYIAKTKKNSILLSLFSILHKWGNTELQTGVNLNETVNLD